MINNIQALGPLQEKWLTILESGIVPQGRMRLCTVVKGQDGKVDLNFCCLGVAEHFVMRHPYQEISKGLLYSVNGEINDSLLTQTTTKEMKFIGAVGGTMETALTALNDGGASFKEIAARIRANPAKYFTGPA